MPTINVEGHSIFYNLHTPKHPRDGDPLLAFLHPFTNASPYWEPQLRSMESSEPTALALRFNCVTFDAPGHGKSAILGEKGRWDHWQVGRVALRLAEELGFVDDGLVIVGDSQGGYAGLRAAIEDAQSSRSLVRGLVLCGSSAEAEDEDLAKAYTDEAAAGFERTCVSESVAAAVAQLARNMAKDGYDFDPSSASASERPERRRDFEWGQQVILDAMTLACNGGKEGGAPETEEGRRAAAALVKRNFEVLVSHESVLSRLAEIRCPALVVHGTRDNAYPFDRENWKRMAQALRASETEVYEDGPHFVTATHAEQLNSRILRFIDERVVVSRSPPKPPVVPLVEVPSHVE